MSARVHWSWWVIWATLAAGVVSEGRQAEQAVARRRRLENEIGDWSGRLHRLAVERDAALAAARAPALADVRPETDQPAAERSVRRYLGRIEDLQEVIARVPDVGIPEMRFLTPDDWIKVVIQLPSLESNADFRRALADVRQEAKRHAVASLSSALANYPVRPEDIPKTVHDIAELASYCLPPLPPEILTRYEIVPPGTLRVRGKDAVIREKDAFAIDRDYDQMAAIFPNMGDVWLTPSRL